MPKYYEAPSSDKPKRSCDGLREDLKMCLLNSDCVKKASIQTKLSIYSFGYCTTVV